MYRHKSIQEQGILLPLKYKDSSHMRTLLPRGNKSSFYYGNTSEKNYSGSKENRVVDKISTLVMSTHAATNQLGQPI